MTCSAAVLCQVPAGGGKSSAIQSTIRSTFRFVKHLSCSGSIIRFCSWAWAWNAEATAENKGRGACRAQPQPPVCAYSPAPPLAANYHKHPAAVPFISCKDLLHWMQSLFPESLRGGERAASLLRCHAAAAAGGEAMRGNRSPVHCALPLLSIIMIAMAGRSAPAGGPGLWARRARLPTAPAFPEIACPALVNQQQAASAAPPRKVGAAETGFLRLRRRTWQTFVGLGQHVGPLQLQLAIFVCIFNAAQSCLLCCSAAPSPHMPLPDHQPALPVTAL